MGRKSEIIQRQLSSDKMATIVRGEKIRIEKLELGPFGTNSYLAICQSTGESVIIDAPGEPDKVMDRLKETSPKFILMTHNHPDHTGALLELHSRLGVPVCAHRLDSGKLPLPPEIELEDGERVSFGKAQIKVLFTPGHTPGSLCFLTEHYLFSGDTIFPGGPGKTGSPENFKKIICSIRTRILTLPDETLVYPGHGEPTVLTRAKAEFAAFSSRPHPSNLCGDVLWL